MLKNFTVSQFNIDRILNLYNKHKFNNFDEFLDYSLPILEWAFKTQLKLRHDIIREDSNDTE